MKHSLRDLHASGGSVLYIVGSNSIKDGEWITVPIFTVTDGVWTSLDRAYGLLCPKADLESASDLWPEARLNEPDNSWLLTVL